VEGVMRTAIIAIALGVALDASALEHVTLYL
jgi:hypothetical protein